MLNVNVVVYVCCCCVVVVVFLLFWLLFWLLCLLVVSHECIQISWLAACIALGIGAFIAGNDKYFHAV